MQFLQLKSCLFTYLNCCFSKHAASFKHINNAFSPLSQAWRVSRREKPKKNSHQIPLKRHCYIIRSLNKTLMKMIEETITVLSLAG